MFSPLDPELVRNLSRDHDVEGRLLASVNGSPFTYPVSLVDGSISVSGSSGTRRKLTATIHAHIDDAECDTFRTELRAEYGIRLLDGRMIWTPVGTFVLVDAQEAGDGLVSISGDDRWRRVVNARFERPRVTSGNHIDTIRDLLIEADPRITFQADITSSATHPQAIWERDRDKAVMQLAQSLGGTVYFDALGVAHLGVSKAVSSNPDWVIGGGEGGALSTSARKRSQSQVYNAMVVEGEDSSGNVAVYAVAKITDPRSKLLYGGPFSKRPRYYRSSLINTWEQAQTTANSLLMKVAGMSSTIDVTGLPHPGLDAGDIIWVEVEPQVWEHHIVDSFTLPLGSGPFSVSTRTGLDEEDYQ